MWQMFACFQHGDVSQLPTVILAETLDFNSMLEVNQRDLPKDVTFRS